MKLDVIRWKEFAIGDLFRLETTKGKTIDDLTIGYHIPYIAAKHDENGLTMMCDYQENTEYISDGNCIIFIQLGEGSGGYVNYINESFIGMNGKTCCGYIDDIMNPEIGAFLTVILCQEKPKYSYGRSWTGDRLSKTIIKLPIQHNPDGTPFIDPDKKYSEQGYVPDWQFMENYIKELHHKPLTTQNKTGCVPELKSDKWQEFKIPKLFTVTSGRYYSKEDYEKGSIPYISASNTGNGIGNMTNLDPDFMGNKITIGKVGATAYYQSEDFCATSDVNILTPLFNMKIYQGLFITQIINTSENYKWSYGRQCRVGDTMEIIIKLPIQHNTDGTPFIDSDKKYSEQGFVPDWQFMEDYIKALPYGDRLN